MYKQGQIVWRVKGLIRVPRIITEVNPSGSYDVMCLNTGLMVLLGADIETMKKYYQSEARENEKNNC